MSNRTLQFFANEVLLSVTEKSFEALASGDPKATVVLSKPMSAIDPTDGDHRDKVARFRGSVADRIALMNRTYKAYAIPAGIALTLGTGVNDETVSGNAMFLDVPSEALEGNELGEGLTSAEVRAAFQAWIARQA